MDEDLLRLSRQKNLGPKSEEWLRAVGIHTLEELEDVGTVEAWRRVRTAGYPATLNLAWALEATLLGLDWRDLPPEAKARLRAELRPGSEASVPRQKSGRNPSRQGA